MSTIPTFPLVQQATACHPAYTALSQNLVHSNQPQPHSHSHLSHLSTPVSRHTPHPFPKPCDPAPTPIGRWSLQTQPPSTASVTLTGPTRPIDLDLGPEQARFDPPPNYSRFADSGYPLNAAYRPHPHHPMNCISPIRPLSSVPMLPFRPPSIPFDPAYHPYDPPSIQHDMQLPSQVHTGLTRPYPSSQLPYHRHHGPPAQPQPQARVVGPSTDVFTHKRCQTQTYPVPAASAVAVRALPSFQSRPLPPVYGSLHSNSSASYHETETSRLPSFELDSIHWNSPPTSSDLPMTPPDHTTAPQLPYSSHQRQSLSSPAPPYVPAFALHFSPARTAPALPTAKADKPKTSLKEGSKDVFQSLKRKRLPVAATFSRPKPRTLPVKKVLPKIHGCRTCGKMFDRPSTLLVHQASHTKAKDYACNKCRKTFSVNSNMRRHWRNCTETPRDHSVPSSPSVPIKLDAPSSPFAFDSSASHLADSPLVPGPSGSGAPLPAFTPSASGGQPPTTTAGVFPTTTPAPARAPAPDSSKMKMAVQPASLRARFAVVSTPELATPVPPVQPRMTRAQELEMRGWFLAEIWRSIRTRLCSWRLWRLCSGSGGGGGGGGGGGARSPPASASAAARVEEDAGFDEDADVDVDAGVDARDQRLWGEERDSWANKGYAPYFGAQWNGVLPGPGPGDPPAVPEDIVDEEEAAC